MSEYKLFDTDIRQGYQILHERLFVVGTKHQDANVSVFYKGTNHLLVFKPEPNNKHDKNAIAIYGEITMRVLAIFKATGQRHLGYVDKETAKELAESNLSDVVLPRLKYMKGYDIEYDIIIPKDKMSQYHEYKKKLLTKSNKKITGYRAEVKEKYGFVLPSSDGEKNALGKIFEKDGEIEKACACYEGCIRNKFEGNYPYDRLAILYRKLKRSEDELRVLNKAIKVFEKIANNGRVDGEQKLDKFKSRLKKLSK